MVDFSHGQELAAAASNAATLWAVGYNHQNLERCPEFLPTLRSFMKPVLHGTSRDAAAAAAAAAP